MKGTNIGKDNIGNNNYGNDNVGDTNSGNRNIGNCNSGDDNWGDFNNGNKNRGRGNTGDFNLGDCCFGAFNTLPREGIPSDNIMLFNKETYWTIEDWNNSEAKKILDTIKLDSKGRLFKREMERWWNNLPQKEKKIIMSIPNFDKIIFKEITGITIKE